MPKMPPNLCPKETPTPAYWGPHLVHVHVSMASFVCPCFRVSAFGIWLKKKIPFPSTQSLQGCGSARPPWVL